MAEIIDFTTAPHLSAKLTVNSASNALYLFYSINLIFEQGSGADGWVCLSVGAAFLMWAENKANPSNRSKDVVKCVYLSTNFTGGMATCPNSFITEGVIGGFKQLNSRRLLNLDCGSTFSACKWNLGAADLLTLLLSSLLSAIVQPRLLNLVVQSFGSNLNCHDNNCWFFFFNLWRKIWICDRFLF